ncbi:MAG: preprotein translocase subunit YajC [Acidimicrobiia bacterium]|nr:preprotein translocase subunit YajC [Acidimicrobiia bacterium]
MLPLIIAQSDTGSSGNILSLVLPLVLLGGIFWVLFILPQRRRMKAVDAMRSSLEVGDEVRTVGGIIGTIQRMDDDEVTLDVGGGTTLRFASRAVADKTSPPEPSE